MNDGHAYRRQLIVNIIPLWLHCAEAFVVLNHKGQLLLASVVLASKSWPRYLNEL